MLAHLKIMDVRIRVEWKEQNCKLLFPQPDYWPRYSPDFRSDFGIMIGPIFLCEIGKTWDISKQTNKGEKPLSNGLKWADCLQLYRVTDLMSKQVSDFCLFVCTSRFANFAKWKWSNHNSKSCSEIRAVTPFWIWLWNFQFETFNFCLFVCTSRFANFAKGKCSNYDSKNCFEIRIVTW